MSSLSHRRPVRSSSRGDSRFATVDRMRFAAIVILAVITNVSFGQTDRPAGRFLFQPMLIWGTSEVTHQGTGYLITHKGRTYGVTSTHFLNFEANGLFEAIWLDIRTSEPVVGFRKSLGKPALTAIVNDVDIQHDFLLLPTAETPANCATLQLTSDSGVLKKGTPLWFPNKNAQADNGYEWVAAEVVEDEGHVIRVKLLSKVKLQSQSGSPFLDRKTNAVVGMLMGGDDKEIYLCPARFILKHLTSEPAEVPLMTSVRK